VTASLLTGQTLIELNFFSETPPRYHSTDQRREIPTLSSPFEEFSRAIARINIDKIALRLLDVLENLNNVLVGEELKGALVSLRRTADDAAAVARELPEIAAGARKSIQRIEAAADRTAREIPKLSQDLSVALDNVARAADRADKLFLDANRVMSPNSVMVRDLQNSLKELGEAARAIRSLANNLERNPESLVRGRGRQP
jgi:paraquat-inducible protein B